MHKWTFELQEHLTYSVESLGEDCLINAAKTSMSSKLIGADSEFFSKMVVDAANAIKMTDGKGGYTYPIKAVNVLKAHGKSARESMLVDGYALNCTIAAQQMPRSIKNAKIACLDFSLQKAKMKMGVQVLVTDPKELDAIRDRESDITKERIQKVSNFVHFSILFILSRHTIRKVKFLSKNSILTKPQHFHGFFIKNFLAIFLVKLNS